MDVSDAVDTLFLGVVPERVEELKELWGQHAERVRLLEVQSKEVRAKADGPVWRKDDTGRDLSLKVLKAGWAAVTIAAASAAASLGDAADKIESGTEAHGPAQDTPAPRASKQSAIIALMQRPGGASMPDFINATGWLPHTTRAALRACARRASPSRVAQLSREAGRSTASMPRLDPR